MAITTTAAESGAPYGTAGGFGGRRIDWTLMDVLLGILWFVALFMVIPTILLIPVVAGSGAKSEEFYASALILAALSDIGIVLVGAAFTFRKYGGDWTRLGFGRVDWRVLAWAFAAFIGALALGAAWDGLTQALPWESFRSECDDQIPKTVLNNNALMVITGVLVVGFAPICEEVFFRGFLLPGLTRRWNLSAGIGEGGFVRGATLGGAPRRWNVMFGIVGSAVLFSAPHLAPRALLPIFAVGLLFAFTYWRSGNLLSTILAHFAFNTVGFSILAIQGCE